MIHNKIFYNRKWFCSWWNIYMFEYMFFMKQYEFHIYVIFYNFIIFLIIYYQIFINDHSNNILFIYNYLKLYEIIIII